MDSENLHRRLKKIIGQVQAIDRMIDEDVPCEDVLSQINAAKSALHKAGQVVLEGHIKHCVLPERPVLLCAMQDRSFWKDTSNTASVKESNMEIRTRPSKTSQKR